MSSVSRGRPQASSRETLADAACELFLEQGYEATTVADITQRAGVSRSSFFNYFDGKAGAIWFALDAHLESATGLTTGDSEDVLAALLRGLEGTPPHTLALAIANADAMGAEAELFSGRALRQAHLANSLLRAGAGLGRDAREREVYVAAQSAAVFSAIWRWANRGAGAHSLGAEVDRSLGVVRASTPKQHDGTVRVAVIGSGAIGRRVASELFHGRVPGAVLSGVMTRRPDALRDAFGDDAAAIADFGADLDSALASSDLVVECAGIAAAKQYGGRVVASGTPLVLVSIGALAQTDVREAMLAGPGELRLTSGAIGGLDLLTAAARPNGIAGGVTSVRITSTKQARSLVQPWMTTDETERLSNAADAFDLFTGSVADAVEKYPSSLNVACALAAATGLWHETEVRLVADPHADRTTHRIEAHGAAGNYDFTMTNEVSPETPTSSAVVAEAVLRGIAAIARPNGTFI